MNTTQLLVLAGTALAAFSTPAAPQDATQPHVQIAEIEIDPAQLEDYKAAVKEQIEAAIRLEPGVLVLYSVSLMDDPTHVRVFEIYRDDDTYRAHLEADHFKKYKVKTEKMVKSLKLVRTMPIILGAKDKQ
jgi:quinol monooxygenase YgiN